MKSLSSQDIAIGWVDPYGTRKLERARCSSHKALGVGTVGLLQHVLPALQDSGRLAIVDDLRRSTTSSGASGDAALLVHREYVIAADIQREGVAL